MTEKISALRAERQKLIDRLRMIDAALERYDAWEREVDQMLGAQTNDVPSGGGSTVMAPKAIRPDVSATPMREFESKVHEILDALGPKQRGSLVVELHKRGVVIGGADEKNTLSARLSRLPWIVNLRGFGYWFKDRDYAPAGYTANQPLDDAMDGDGAASADGAIQPSP